MTEALHLTRRNYLKGTGTLIVAFSLARSIPLALAQEAGGQKSLALDQVDTFLQIDQAGHVTVYIGKIDFGTGTHIGLAQMAADELDVKLEAVSIVQGDTALTPDQGPTYGSLTIEKSGVEMRHAAATARQALLAAAAKQLNLSPSELSVSDGVVRAKTTGASVSYGDLIGGKAFAIPVDPQAPLKTPSSYKYVGKPLPRRDIPGKVTGQYTYMQDFRRPGMLYAAVVRPPAISATLQAVDEGSIARIGGIVKIVRQGNFLAIVAKNEWASVRAARELKTTWMSEDSLPDQADIWAHVRSTKVAKQDVTSDVGDVQKAFASRGKTLSATYDFALHTHGSIGPSCAISEFNDGKLTSWSASQETHRLRGQLATMLSIPETDVRCIFVEGAGCYGLNGSDDVAANSALLAKQMGVPVRVQWMRHDEHGWDPKGPPTLIDLKAVVDEAGKPVGWESNFFIPQGAGKAVELMPAALAGLPTTKELNPGGITNDSAIAYKIPNIRTVCHRLETTPLRPAWIRAPGRMQNTFANESFFDEIAAELKRDPLELRRELLDPSDVRGLEVLDRLKSLAKWQSRTAPRKQATGNIAFGSGASYVKYELRRTYVGGVAEVEVDKNSGKIRVRKFFVVHDCGQIINPTGVQAQIEGCVIQTTSRTLMEELTFDRRMVTSLDWASYPILRFEDVPEVIVDLIDRPSEVPWGVGEPTSAIVSAAISNAIFDATGARLRSVPFKAEKMRDALKGHG